MTTITNRDQLDKANPNTLPDHLRALLLGTVLATMLPQVRRNKVPAADAGSSVSTVEVIALPNNAKANSILRAYARTGTAGMGALVIALPGVTPASGEIAVASNGDIMVLAADALTNIDVEYVPERGDVVVLTGVPVVSNVATLPASVTSKGAVLLLDANPTTATSTGRKRVLSPSASTPATGACRLNVAKTTVTFASADAVTVATLTLLVASADDLADILEAESVLL